ncbi:MAG TPA: thioesterase family protein [Gemmatimonadales bacterium]|nr:thioesterase family protein [Gemmatimonadales bacterium]
MTETFFRVNYSEVDQMGVVYHARYLVWLDVARCEHLRRTGVSYAELERRGLRLAVSEARVRYRQPARYDDLVRVRCWVREAVSRRISFGYALDLPGQTAPLATAAIALLALDADFSLSRLPTELLTLLPGEPDPVRLF